MNKIHKIYSLLIIGIVLILLSSCTKQSIIILLSPEAGKTEQLAAGELQRLLTKVYPNENFTISNQASGGSVIYLGTNKELSSIGIESEQLAKPADDYCVKANRETVVISGHDNQNVLLAVYALGEKLGYAYTFNADVLSETKTVMDFSEWELSDKFLLDNRYIFNWHNFLSGCTGWNLKDWEQWVNQSQKMGFNTIMVHAYSNNPMFQFEFNGFKKPVGFIANSQTGRDWSTEHVNDVRRLPGGDIFDDAIFGSDVSKVANEERIKAAQQLMQQVFTYARERGLGINFAIDFDIYEGIPQNMVKSIPLSGRFLKKWKKTDVWLPKPDTPEGYNYCKAQVKRVLQLYPQITRYTLWKRGRGGRVWNFEEKELPADWKAEFQEVVRKNSTIKEMNYSASNFAQSKLITAYQKIFKELGREDVKLSVGTWRWDDIEAMNMFYPEDVSVFILDSEIERGELHLRNDNMIEEISGWVKKGKIIPVIWAQHDDGAYFGSPMENFDNFYDLTQRLKANSFGIIHWMTRPLDTYFIHHIKQIKLASKNQNIETTLTELASKWFGKENAEIMTDYLIQWDKNMSTVGRETREDFIDSLHYYKFKEADKVVSGCNLRIKLLESVNKSNLNEEQLNIYNYFLNLEKFVKLLFIEQNKFINAEKLVVEHKYPEAKEIIKKFQPESVMDQFAKTIQNGGASQGEKGMLFSMGVRWMPHFISLKQIVGSEPVRINFGPTNHEALAQRPGFRTYFIDKESNYWLTLGEQETNCKVVSGNTQDSNEINDYAIKINAPLHMPIKAFTRPQPLVKGKYSLELFYAVNKNTAITVKIGKTVRQLQFTTDENSALIELYIHGNNDIEFSLICNEGEVDLYGLKLQKVK